MFSYIFIDSFVRNSYIIPKKGLKNNKTIQINNIFPYIQNMIPFNIIPCTYITNSMTALVKNMSN